MKKKVTLAHLIQKDVEDLILPDLKDCDRQDTKLGDAYLLQCLDTVQAEMSKRKGFAKQAKALDSCITKYFDQLYPKDFVKGLTADNRVSTTNKSGKK